MTERTIIISAGSVEVAASLNESPTGSAIWHALPIEESANTWGDEIFFDIPVEADIDESAREVVELGDIGYWPPGNALCLFFGPTPLSVSGEIRPASAVNVVGVIRDDPTVLKQVAPGELIIITRA